MRHRAGTAFFCGASGGVARRVRAAGAVRPHTVDELYRAPDHARMSRGVDASCLPCHRADA
ncbi:hypothetical protein Acsp04_12950 [Actinomadura sp. NBRC 104425]|uniref:hypothetical protein n=1 Tax=Actinomadura sp. NBRC 104425 TaxID=3032204 RepID=UPI0024A16E70|nr:hypothetical protein [Actinomadura sp. NBRC 104425]GLZ11060.1 hypothetical protein Acsp04_12950 [Actinomadura sp. NBRC 104425]